LSQLDLKVGDKDVKLIDAAHDIVLGEFDEWRDSKRVVVNCYTHHKEYGGVEEHPDPMSLFGLMAEYTGKSMSFY
jgi:hypothetical protein